MADNYLRMNGKLLKFNDKLLTITTGGGGAAYPTDGLLARFALDDDLTDSYGSYTATNDTGTLTYTTGLINKCGDFTGANIIETSIPSSIMEGLLSWSTSIWIKNPDTGGVSRPLTNFFSGGNWSNHTDPLICQDSTLPVYGGNRAGNDLPNGVALGTDWHHFVTTYDGTTTKIFVDAATTPYTSEGNTTNIGAGNGKLYIGGIGKAGGHMIIAKMGLVYVYNKAISSDDISALYNSGAGV